MITSSVLAVTNVEFTSTVCQPTIAMCFGSFGEAAEAQSVLTNFRTLFVVSVGNAQNDIV